MFIIYRESEYLLWNVHNYEGNILDYHPLPLASGDTKKKKKKKRNRCAKPMCIRHFILLLNKI